MLEHLRILHPDRRERIDVEEPSVVDLLGRDAPVRESVRLRVEKLVQQIEAARLPLRAVEDADVLFQVFPHGGAGGAEGRDAALDHFLLAPPLLLPRRILLVARWHVLEHEDDALQLVQRLALAQLLLQLLDAVAEDLAIGAGVHGKDVIVIADPEGPLVQLELDLAPLEDGAVGVAEDRHQHLAGELLLHRVPLDIEKLRSLRGGAILQQIEPERVARPDAHVIRHDVEHVPETGLVQSARETLVSFSPAQLGVDRAVVGHVVPVHRSGRRREDRAGVQVGDSELGEIARDRGRAVEREALVQL